MNRYQKLFNELKQENAVNTEVNDHLMVFDGLQLNTFIRSFGATPAYNEDGDHVGGISGFLYSVGKTIRDFKPTRCIIVFDGRGGSAKRKRIYKDYKGNRANKTKLRRHDHHDSTLEQEQESIKPINNLNSIINNSSDINTHLENESETKSKHNEDEKPKSLDDIRKARLAFFEKK